MSCRIYVLRIRKPMTPLIFQDERVATFEGIVLPSGKLNMALSGEPSVFRMTEQEAQIVILARYLSKVTDAR